MKTIFATAILLCSFVMLAFADGGIPIGGRQCPQPPEPCPTGFTAEQPKPATGVKLEILGKIVFREIFRGFRIW